MNESNYCFIDVKIDSRISLFCVIMCSYIPLTVLGGVLSMIIPGIDLFSLDGWTTVNVNS